MNLHTRSQGRTQDLVVFVHGLNGTGYKTWGNFPAFLFNDYSRDVAIFDYRTGLRRLGGGAKFSFYIEQFAECIRELATEYSSIFLLGHSLGGLLIEAAVREYLIDRAMTYDLRAIEPIAGIVLMASPRAGSAWAIPILRRIVSEGRWLQRGSSHTARIDDFFSSYIQNYNTVSIESEKTLVPCYGCLAGNDWFVNAFSAGFGIPSSQKRRLIRGGLYKGHSSIVKPPKADEEQVRWLVKVIREVNEVREQRRREIHHAGTRTRAIVPPLAPVIVTEFWPSSSGRPWAEIYNEVRRSAATPDLEVHDYRDAPGLPLDLLMAVSDAETVLLPGSHERSKVEEARARREANERLTVGISPVGERSGEAKGQVEQWLHAIGWLPSMYVEEAVDTHALRIVLARWVQVVVDRDPRRGRSQPARIERALRTDLDAYDPTGGGGIE
jgi:pimeloyl-ACP methyl ester carboxylesterase